MEKFNPLVSIIIPVYNGANYMKEAIDSAIAQSYKNIEIIVVNDGSTDNGETERIALSYGDKIKYFYKENGGCASALNFGIEKMQGEYFSWLSHDDVYLKNKIESAIDKINQFNLDKYNTVVVCENMAIDQNGNEVFCKKPNCDCKEIDSIDMFLKMMNGRALNGCALLIPKSAIDKVGAFSTTYVYILDWIYWINLALSNVNFFEYKEVLVKNRKHQEQVSVKKRDRLITETKQYLSELIDKNLTDKQMNALWSYCYRIGHKEGCQNIAKKQNIPFAIRANGIFQKLEKILKQVIRRIIYCIYK